MAVVEVKRIDPQGRLVIPKSWRERWGNEVIVIELEDKIEIIPRKRPRLSRFFDIIDAEIKGTDLEKELLESLY
ncbi:MULTISPECIES: AbrB/MazE/SpoVT family DNA-binding domain-containing protein [Thermococcus]|uniref:AbrB family transcriptional regulator n=1 Tax=Thermococcus camini TaxID=2016373 RepID=A0A7G2D5J5_9EURY|nr:MULTISPECIES: AbrB/MazE/SpoVT family DNA-binding domain-containing protein [Thermococcus]NJE09746.1 AbrB/MazE/SpoVT family DNA-binding domain-containing protein [Thermococcus sp. MAR1]CAD5243698.1 AbrB family transcriptional regulator [Thermococcus camini]